MPQLSGKIAVITGSAQGIGRAVAEIFSERGANLSLWDRKTKALQETSAKLSRHVEQCLTIKVDVTKKRDVDRATDQTTDALGGIDILVNAAGVHTSVLFKDMTEEDWDFVQAVNAKGTFLCCKAVAPVMVRRNWGRIINIASDAGKTGHATEAHYAASKHAVVGLTKVLALELARNNIRVNAICPGYIETPMLKQVIKELSVIEDKSEQDIVKEITSLIPVGRLGTPEDIGKTAAFLASDDAEYINGQSIGVCGGLEMH